MAMSNTSHKRCLLWWQCSKRNGDGTAEGEATNGKRLNVILKSYTEFQLSYVKYFF